MEPVHEVLEGIYLKKCIQKGLKKCDYTIYMDMNIETLPKKGLKTRPNNMDMSKKDLKTSPYSIDMSKRDLKTRPYSIDMDIATLSKKNLKTRPYNMDMSKRDLKTSPYSIDMSKRDLKTSPYSIDMEKKDLKKLTKGQLIKLLVNQRKKPTPPPRNGKWESVKPKPVL